MIIPYSPEDTFETHDAYEIVSFEDGILVVDNWYKNFSDIKKLLLNTPVPKWKASNQSRNFVDYLDCRLILPIHFPTEKTNVNMMRYLNLVARYYGINSVQVTTSLYEFNYYKNINRGVPKSLQHYPHMDYDINCLIYMDDISSGGTAIYETDQEIENKEENNLLFDVSKLGKKVIQAKPNRMVMFKGDRYHGGFIENHDAYVDNWRINQVIFFKQN